MSKVSAIAAVSTTFFLAVPYSASAFTVTTPAVNFQTIGSGSGAAGGSVPQQLLFDNFNTVRTNNSINPLATLNSVRWIINTPATVGGRARLTNQSEDTDRLVSGSNVSYIFSLSPAILGTNLSGSSATAASANCVTASSTCSNTIPFGTTRTVEIGGLYSSVSTFASLTALQKTQFSTGAVTATYFTSWTGTGADFAWNFNPTISASVTQLPFISGTIALEYDYSLPTPPPTPGAQVPAPLPVLGAFAAFGWTRRLRNRITA